MIDVAPVFRVLGGMLFGLALAMLLPAGLHFGEARVAAAYFGLGAVLAAFSGAFLLLIGHRPGPFSLDRRQGFLLVVSSWFVLPVYGAVPLMEEGLDFLDAYFEAVSALTTTGATVMTGLDDAPRAVLLWRSLLQYMGGVGIVAMGIILMPFLRVGGMQLFQIESSDRSEKILARSFDLLRWIVSIYLLLALACGLVYRLLGMSWFDAVNHAMTTVSTGGFSTHDASFGHFASPALEWAGVAFMASGALPFVAYIRLARGRPGQFVGDIQIRAFLGFVAAAALLIGATHAQVNDVPFAEALRLAAFNVMSVVTTTGFASADYQTWGNFALGAFLVLTFVGGCSGSTSGGVKIYRFQILRRLAAAHFSQMASPSRVSVVIYHDRRVEPDVGFSILAFLGALLLTLFVLTAALGWMGLDLVTAFTGAATCLTNVGPGLGPVIGPAGNFASLPDAAKALLAVAMILGRLEFFAFFVLLTPAYWRG